MVVSAIGTPVLRRRPAGLYGLVRIIIQQQLSVASAQAILGRCEDAIDIGEASAILALDDDTMRSLGLSRPKSRYIRAAAEAVQSGALDFRAVAQQSDEDATDALVAIKGIGPWTAAIYLLFCEGRLSVWPPRDVALLAAYTAAAGLDERPPMDQFDADAAVRYRPMPGLAAHALWTYYGVLKNRTPV